MQIYFPHTFSDLKPEINNISLLPPGPKPMNGQPSSITNLMNKETLQKLLRKQFLSNLFLNETVNQLCDVDKVRPLSK